MIRSTARQWIAIVAPTIAAGVLISSGGCHCHTRHGLIEVDQIAGTLADPPSTAPDRASRDLLRAAPRLKAKRPNTAAVQNWIGVVLFNHGGEPLARMLIQRREGEPPLVLGEQVEARGGWRKLDAPEFKHWWQDAKRAHAQFANAGAAPRWVEHDDRILLTLPGGGADNEVWLEIPLRASESHRASWSYSNDFGGIEGGPLGVWTIKQVFECRTF